MRLVIIIKQTFIIIRQKGRGGRILKIYFYIFFLFRIHEGLDQQFRRLPARPYSNERPVRYPLGSTILLG